MTGQRTSGQILIVEDDAHIAEGLRFNLEAEGYDVTLAEDGRAGAECLTDPAQHFDLVILDLRLPEMSGFEVARRTRAAGNYVAILMLTAKDDAADIVRGIEEGADDYLTKPFQLDELLARVKALLRRRRWEGVRGPEPSREFRFGDVTVYYDRFELETPAGRVSLTTREMGLLRALIEREGEAVPRGELLEDVWGLRPETQTRVIDSFVVRLRRHLETDPTRPRHIVSVRGHGYKFVR